MFGKRSNQIGGAQPAPTPARNLEPVSAKLDPSPSGGGGGQSMQTEVRPDSYYHTKSMIFGALIEAIDLSALAKLDPDSAREEIRDIVHEIVDDQEPRAVDLRAGGPARRHLQRRARLRSARAAAGARRHRRHHGQRPDQTFIEVGGKIQLTNIRFRDAAQLMNICQRIVSQVGRRVDEASPICDARLLDGSRVNVIAPPLAIDGAALTIRKFKKDKLTLDQLVPVRRDFAGRRGNPQDHRPRALQRRDFRRHRLGQDDAPQLPDQLHRGRRARHHLRRRGRTAAPAAPCRAARDAPAQSRRRRARSRCATSSRTVCVCVPNASSWAKCADPKPSTSCRR